MDKIMSLGLKSHLGHVGMETANIDRQIPFCYPASLHNS